MTGPRAAILSPGPSLPETFEDGLVERFAMVIGVNQAVEHIRLRPTDWWCCGDIERYEAITPITTPAGVAALELKQAPRERFGHPNVLFFSELLREVRTLVPDHLLPNRSCSYSATAAMVLAYRLLPTLTELVCYGFDMAGAGYAWNEPAHKRHIEARWNEERRIYRELCEWLGRRGVRVVRHLTAREAVA